jgi:hypothetical protein
MTTYTEWIAALDLAIMWDFKEVSLPEKILYFTYIFGFGPRFERHVSKLSPNSSNQEPSSIRYFLLKDIKSRSGCETDISNSYKAENWNLATISAPQR